MRPAAAIAGIATLVALAGCANTLMPTPVGFDRDGADPFESTPGSGRTPDVRFFVAANRKTTGSTLPAEHFGPQRSQTMRLGTMTVGIGDGQLGWEALEALSRTDERPSDPEMRLRAIDDFGGVWTGLRAMDPEPAVGPRTVERFVAAVREAMAASGTREVYVFVHGFNTSVDGNAAVSASMFHYLGRAGAFVQFEWPSRNSIWSYQADKAAASASLAR